MRGGGRNDAAPFALFHARHCGTNGVKRRRQIDGDDLIPFIDWKFLDRGHELDTGIVDQNIERAKGLLGLGTMSAISSGLVMSAGE